MPERPHRLNPASTDLSREKRSEAVLPEPYRLMGYDDTPLMQQVFNIPQRKRVSDVHHYRQADDLGRGLEIPEDAGVAHAVRLDAHPAHRKPIFPLTLP